MAQAIDTDLGGAGASAPTQFVFKGCSLTSRLPSGERETNSPGNSAASATSTPFGGGSPFGTATGTSHVIDGPPVLLDCSVHEGSCRGGTAVWLHGKRLRPDMTVTFGGVPCTQAPYSNPNPNPNPNPYPYPNPNLNPNLNSNPNPNPNPIYDRSRSSRAR